MGKATKEVRARILKRFTKGDLQSDIAADEGLSTRTVKRVIADDRKKTAAPPLEIEIPAGDLPDTEKKATAKGIEIYAEQLLQLQHFLRLITPKIKNEMAGTHSQHLKNYVTAQGIWLDKVKQVTREISKLEKEHGPRKPIMPAYTRKVIKLRDVTEEDLPKRKAKGEK
ncbi:MAG: hypothetical protein ACYTBJ_01110 [Planctomycetota bacterium]|jgi:predicted transcriptional regulator